MASSSTRIVHLIPNLSVGGAETFLVRLIPLLPPIQTVVLFWNTRSTPPSRIAAIAPHCTVICIDPFRTSPASIFKFLRLFISLTPNDCVFSWLHMSDLFASLIKILHPRKFKLIWNIRNIPIHFGEYSLSSYLSSVVCTYFFNQTPDKIVFNSQASKAAFLKKNLPPEKCTVIPNGFDISPSPYHMRTVHDQFTLICCARFHPQKNHLLLLKSFSLFRRHVPTALLRLVGHGCDPSNSALISTLKNLDLMESVLLYSTRPYSKTLDLMRTSHVSLLLSTFGESFPNVIAESIICGCYPIATDVGDAAYIIHSSGSTVSVEASPHDINSHLLTLYSKFMSSPKEWNNERQFFSARLSASVSLDKTAHSFIKLISE